VLTSGVKPITAAILMGLASVLVLMPIPVAWRVLALVVVLSSFPARETPVTEGEFRVMALDVGQGLSVVVDTARHRLVYDAGPRYRSGFDLGAAVVAPALRATGHDNVELLIVSHADNDHAGGERSVRGLVSVRAVLRGSPDAALSGARCAAGKHWQWDGVRFELLHPLAALAERRNDQSCVLLITNRAQAVLLPGDISAAVERRLASIQAVGKLTLLVAPHHGSRTSSSGSFLAATSPRFAWFSAGYLNRFSHPDAEVVARYDRIGARIYTTADAGALLWASDRSGQVDGWRRLSPRFWR
jgi:competence protein ComEC